jgi:hypothetical protein
VHLYAEATTDADAAALKSRFVSLIDQLLAQIAAEHGAEAVSAPERT